MKDYRLSEVKERCTTHLRNVGTCENCKLRSDCNMFKFAPKVWNVGPKCDDVISVTLDEGAVMPTKAHEADAGFDLYARNRAAIPPKMSAVFDTGVHIAIPRGYVGMLKSKSGLNVKSGITSEGVIDSGYTGSIIVKLYNNGDKVFFVDEKMKITQIVILPIPKFTFKLVEKLEDTERGDNGFGSSGR